MLPCLYAWLVACGTSCHRHYHLTGHMAFSPQVINSQMQVQQHCLLLYEQNFTRVSLAGCIHRSLDVGHPLLPLHTQLCVEKGYLASSDSSSLDNITWMMKSYKWMTGPLLLLFWQVILGNIANNSVMQAGETWQSHCGALGCRLYLGWITHSVKDAGEHLS